MTLQEEKRLCPRMMISIIRAEDEKRLDEVLEAVRIPVYYRCRAEGTAPSEMMDIFGLRGTTRLITVSFLPRFRVKEVFEDMAGQMSFRKRGGGIAISIPITGMQGPLHRMLDEEEKALLEKRLEGDEAYMKEHSAYSVVWVSVARGYSDDVVDAAREAGARGGTVIKGRRRGSERAMQYLGISVQEEQEFVMIVVPNEKKTEVMSAISRSCGLKSEAHGVVLSLPVDEVMGLA